MRITITVLIVSGLLFQCFASFAIEGVGPVETRGVWVDKSDVYKGKDYLIEMFDKITSANLNAVYLPTQYKSSVIYPNSKYLPQDEAAKKIDPEILQWMIDEARKRHLFIEAWPEYGFYAYHTPDATKDPSKGALLDKDPELAAIDINGTPYLHNEQWGDFYSLCPSNPKSHEIMIGLYIEMISRYPFDGIDLDRIRYPTKDFCFCPYCKEHFNADTGFELTADTLKKEEILDKFYEWRKEQLNTFMRKLHKEIREARPEILISSAVWTPDQVDEKGQDWETWLKEGYIDVAIPMMYWKNIEPGVTESIKLVEDPRRVVCGISAEANSSEILANQIELCREQGTGGVIIWYLGKLGDDLDFLRTGVFRDRTCPFTYLNQ